MSMIKCPCCGNWFNERGAKHTNYPFTISSKKIYPLNNQGGKGFNAAIDEVLETVQKYKNVEFENLAVVISIYDAIEKLRRK